MTLKAWLDDWLALRSPDLKPRTVESYRDLINRHIAPVIGEIGLKDLTALEITHMLATISAAGHSRTAEMCFVLLRSALQELEPNPMRKVRRPAHRQKSPNAWTDDQITLYLSAIKEHKHQLAFMLALLMGLRRGEICGLRWQDIDFRKEIIHICNQRQRLETGEIVDLSPKSESSVRDLPIPAPLMPLLRSKRQLAGYVCCLTPSGLDAAHRALTLKLDLPYTPLHGLRHSMATACIRHGGNMKSLQLLLGHANYATTANKYTHPDMEMLLQAIEKSSALCYNVLQ